MPRAWLLLLYALAYALSSCVLRPAGAIQPAARTAAPQPHRDPAPPAEPAEPSEPLATAEAENEAEDDPGALPSEELSESPAPPTSSAPAMRYGALDKRACEAELTRRKIGFARVDTARGVVAPVRLTGPLSGVTFRANLPASKRSTAVIEIYDCRLVLALDDFAKILAKHDIEEVVHLSVYRPVSKKRRLKNGVGRRHSAALAIDAAIFKTKDGRTLDVKKDFDGRIRSKTCPPPKTASELRNIACEASDARIFNVLLTPNYNRAHNNHFHLEVTAGAKWFYLR